MINVEEREPADVPSGATQVDTLWVDAAWLGSVVENVRFTIQSDRIVEIQRGVSPTDDDLQLSGLAIPGLINAHSHAFHRLLRATSNAGQSSFWDWQREMYRVAEMLTPDNYRHLATAVFTEMVLAGITTIGEFHYIHHQPDGTPYADSNVMGSAIVAAAGDVGIRLTLIDTCYLRGWFDREVSGAQRRFSDGSVDKWLTRVDLLQDSALVHHAVAAHSVRSVAPADIARIVDYARHRAIPIHAHVSEQPAENEACLEHTGLTPMGVFDQAGALFARFTAVHATHASAQDITLLGQAGAIVCFCPTTERDLGDGIGPSGMLTEAGATIALGSDSHAVIDPFIEMRLVELHQRLANSRRGTHQGAHLIDMGTVHGATSLGWDDAGSLTVGGLADITIVSQETVRTVASRSDALEMLVFSATASDVTDTIVGGRRVVEEGRHHCYGDGVQTLFQAQLLFAE